MYIYIYIYCPRLPLPCPLKFPQAPSAGGPSPRPYNSAVAPTQFLSGGPGGPLPPRPWIWGGSGAPGRPPRWAPGTWASLIVIVIVSSVVQGRPY